MTNAHETIHDIVHEQAPLKTSAVISHLYDAGIDMEEAAVAVSTDCEIVDRDDGEYVVGLKNDTPEAATRSVQIDRLDQPPGEPTGQYFDGRRITDEPVGLPVLEDVGHPLVPELTHDYYPREMRGNRTDLEVVVRSLADPDFATLLIGETGVGKNVLLKKIFAECNWPMQRTNFGIGVDYESLVGRFAPRDAEQGVDDLIRQAEQIAEATGLNLSDAVNTVTAQQSSFEFVSGILKQCATNGYAFVGDEINMVAGESTATLHGLTEEKASRELVIQDTSEVITPDERFLFVGTMNPIDYSGTHRLNRAFQTRFYPLQIPYLENDAEERVLLEKSNLSEHDNGQAIAESLVDLADKLRSQMAGGNGDSGQIMTAVSSRDLIKIGNMIADPDGAEFMKPQEATKLILEGIAAPGDWNPISTTIDTINFHR